MQQKRKMWPGWLVAGLLILLVGCGVETAVPTPDDHDQDAEARKLSLPALTAVSLNGAPLKVVATTSIIGDVVAQVGGEAIALTTLMEPGQDPHSFEPGARSLTSVAVAHVIFVNGWDLEEALVQDLAEIGAGVPQVAISANITPLALAEDSNHEHGTADPHVWLAIPNVAQWAKNVAQVLSDLDPANAATYERNAAAYLAQLSALQSETENALAQIPTERRFLVTNHDALSYFAHAYGFTVLGTVIPGSSTLAEPSASDLTALIETMAAHNICTIFTDVTVSDALAQTAANELPNCDEVQVLPLYTGAVGPANSGADSFVGMFQANVAAIVEGLTR